MIDSRHQDGCRQDNCALFRSREGHTGELVRPKLPTFRARSYGKDTSLTSSYLRYGLQYECLQVLLTDGMRRPVSGGMR